MTTLWKKTMLGLSRLWSHLNEGPQAEWDRMSLCSLAPLSAEALRGSEEAERAHAPH